MAATPKPSEGKPRKSRAAASTGANMAERARDEPPPAAPSNAPQPPDPSAPNQPIAARAYGGMDRDTFSRVFYGDGDVPPPWATDCPVKFEVWLEYANV